MSESRKINFSVNLDTSNVSQQAGNASKSIESELAKQKANIEKLLRDVAASGGKIKVPMEDFRAAINATKNALVDMSATNGQKLDELAFKLKQNQKLITDANGKQWVMPSKGNDAIEKELSARRRLNREIESQLAAVEKLEATAQKATAAEANTSKVAKTLSQKIAENKRRMQELAASNQQGSKEYQELSTKAKEYSNALKQVNADSKADAQVRLRTELMNAKQAMSDAERQFGKGSIQFQQARDKAIQLQQAMNSMNKQVKLMSAPNAMFQGIVSGLSGISGTASAAMGSLALFGGESEKTQQFLAKLNAVMSITMGLQSMSMMLNQNSALQLNIVGRLTTWWANCKAKAAGAIATETAAVEVNTAAEKKQAGVLTANTTAQNINTTAVNKGTAANTANAFSWKAVSIAIKSIPIIGWIALFGTLIATIVSLTKSTYNAAKAKKELQKKTLEANKSAADELVQLRLLYAQTQDVTKSMEARRAAAMRMQELYPSVFSSLRTEAILAGDAAKAYNDLAASILNKAKAEARQERIKDLEKDILDSDANWENDPDVEYWVKKRLKAMFDAHQAGRDLANDPDYQYASTMVGILEKKYNRDKIDQWKKEQETLQQEVVQMTETPIEQLEAAVEGSVANLKAKMEDAERRANASIKSVDSEGNITYYTDAERAQARKDYYKYRRQYEAARFNTKDYTNAAGAADIAEQKETDQIIKAQRERAKALLKMAQELEQALIDKMDEGYQKRARQRKLNDQKEIDGIYTAMQGEIEAEVARQKAIWDAREDANAKAAAAKGKQYRKKAFSSGDILTTDFQPGDNADNVNAGNVDRSHINTILAHYGTLNSVAIQSQQKRLDDERKAQKLAMQEYLQDYGTYEEKKIAIAQIYAEKRRNANSDAEKMRLTQEENQAYADLEFDNFVKEKASLAFGEIDNLNQETIADLIQQLEEFKDKATESFDPDKIEKYNQALAKLKKAQALGEGGLFGRLFDTDYNKQRMAAQAELNAAEKAHNDLLNEKAKKEQEVKDKVQEIISKVKELTGEELTPDQVTDGASVGGIIEQLFGKDNEDGANALSGMMNDLNDTRTELGGITEASDKAAVSFQNLGKQFAATFQGEAGTLGMISAIVGKIDEAVQEAANIMNELAETAELLGADTGTGSGWEQATEVMNALAEATGAAKKIIESLISLNPVGVIGGVVSIFTSWINAFATIHDNTREKKIQKMQEELEELERINKRIEHRLEKQYSKEASRSYEQEIQNLEKQRALIQQQIAAEQDKKNTDDERIQEWKDQYEELGWQIQDYKDKALDAIIGEDISSSIDNFADALADSWGKTADRAKATKDYVKSMLRQMVLEAMKTDLTGPITQMRQMMTDAMADDVVTEAEKKELEKFAQDLGQMIENRYSWADDIIKDSTNGQSGATTGGFATASQDSIEELSGRAAAIHTSGEMRRELLMNIRVDLAGIREQMAQSRETSDEIRSLQLIAVGHLETIAKNTHELYEMNERLDKIERNTRNL